ncbi:galactokinase [Parabacteroides sp. FAFU027]|uniref:galactokinase n=1 Tax=Parabacteroides sp. FAFU027 TaxID=2922715 RepID=UPI001FAE81BC|nr:galactokinase [Parabacteroides sp. FAFU027]
MKNLEIVRSTFKEKFGTDGSVYFSPGRINLIGEHTDYNGGFVLPGAVDKGMLIELKPNGTDKIRAYSIDLKESSEFGMNEEDRPAEGWARYIFGVVRELAKRDGKAEGFDTVFTGDVPLGAGMSSSAALESAYAYALNDIFKMNIDKKQLVKVGQMTEHNYVGVNCGIMDQFASIFGKEGHLIKLDCSNMEFEYVPFEPKGYKVVLLDSVVKHALVGSPYNERRLSCERVAKEVNKKYPEVEHMCQANFDQLNAVKELVSAEDFMRAEYAVGEAERLRTACDAMTKGDFETVGKMMYGTHWGMSKLYEVSCEELDFLATVAEEAGVTGSRIMGGGFGGCTINVVKEDLYDGFIAKAKKEYSAKYGHEPKVYDVVIGEGSRKIC